MKKDTELDNLLEEYQNLMNPKVEEAMFIAMSEKYGKISEDRESVIQSLKERIKALKIIKGIKEGTVKTYPIDTLWKEL